MSRDHRSGNLYQAYGSYLASVGSGLQVDFGKFASSLGAEGNYTKDQIAYSRSYSFNYLPFYHMGLRANYNVTPKVNVAYRLVNGANDTEDLNGFKSQAFLFTLKPASTLTWNTNYYFGQEARDVQPTLNPGLPSDPPSLGSLYRTSAPQRTRAHLRHLCHVESHAKVDGGRRGGLRAESHLRGAAARPSSNWRNRSKVRAAAQLERRCTGRALRRSRRAVQWNHAGFEGGYLRRDHALAPGFLARAEYRRDFSNQRFFPTDTTGVLARAQTTATLGLVYWWGMKQGSW